MEDALKAPRKPLVSWVSKDPQLQLVPLNRSPAADAAAADFEEPS